MATLKSLSIEDRNLNQVTSIVSKKLTAYKDIDLTFSKKVNGDVFKKVDAAAVKQSVKNIILGNYYEKPFLPYWGANLTGLLFELGDDLFTSDIESRVRGALRTYEPRAEVLDVIADINPDNNYVNVFIRFKVVNTEETTELEVKLTRLR
jgi:phage baseplate assembly protein W